jgi:hypothetical protein
VICLRSRAPALATIDAMKKKRSPRPRTLARKAAASAVKLTGLREKLAELSPGGSAAAPISVESAAVIELRAVSEPCPACAGPLKLAAHEVEAGGGALLRRVELRCARCDRHVTRWFVVAAKIVH